MGAGGEKELQAVDNCNGFGQFDEIATWPGEMTPESHAQILADEASELVHHRQIVGQQAHGGRLWRKNTGRHLLEELADAFAYAQVLLDQRRESIDVLHSALSHLTKPDGTRDGAVDSVRRGINILAVGNPEGIEEEELED